LPVSLRLSSREAATTFNQLNDFVWRSKAQTLGQRRLQIGPRNWQCQPWRSMKDMYTRCRSFGFAMLTIVGEE
jgi:hypothetical protein